MRSYRDFILQQTKARQDLIGQKTTYRSHSRAIFKYRNGNRNRMIPIGNRSSGNHSQIHAY
jgi:hypothetical protein